MLGTFRLSYVSPTPEIPTPFVYRSYSYLYYMFPEAIKSMLYLFIFWEPCKPSRARTRTNTKVGSVLPSAKPSLSWGLLRGGIPRTSQKMPMFFLKIFHIQASSILRKVDTRHKRLWNGIGRAAGPPTPLGYGIPTHLPTPKLLMSAKFLIEHKNSVTKTVCMNSQGPERPHCQFTLICPPTQKYD